MYRDWNTFDHKLRALTSINAQQNCTFLLSLIKILNEENGS